MFPLCLPGFSTGPPAFPPQSTDMHVRMIGNSKLATGVSANGCLSLRDKLSWCYIAFTPRQLKLLHLPTLSYIECRVELGNWWTGYKNDNHCMKYFMYTLWKSHKNPDTLVTDVNEGSQSSWSSYCGRGSWGNWNCPWELEDALPLMSMDSSATFPGNLSLWLRSTWLHKRPPPSTFSLLLMSLLQCPFLSLS